MRAPALAIAAWVHGRGAASSGEILERFEVSESTLRRRRPELERLGIRFAENGHGSIYVSETIAEQLPSTTEHNPDTSDRGTTEARPRHMPANLHQSSPNAAI